MKKDKDIIPLPFDAYYLVVLVITLIGLADAIYLSISHYRVYTDIGYKSFCAVSKAINCDTVSQSEYSILLNVPVPIWGIVGYLIVLALLYKAWQCRLGKKYYWPTLFFISFVFSTFSLVLALISSLIIKSYCIMCILSYAVNFALLFYAWLIYKRFEKDSIIHGLKADICLYSKQWKKYTVFIFTCMVITIGMTAVIPDYWNMEFEVVDTEIPKGVTDDGHPWIGAVNPELTITEFSDYQCFQCKKMHLYLRQLIAKYPDKLRLIHRHFPMDHSVNPIVKDPFHIGSGRLALLALFALEKGKFWELNDMLFKIESEGETVNIRRMAAAVGFDVLEFAGSINHPYFRNQLYADILAGIKRGVTGTPGFVIDGTLYLGQIPAELLARL